MCSLDVDEDGVTDLLLVGAPMYMNELRREEGKVYLFSVTKVNMSKMSLFMIIFCGQDFLSNSDEIIDWLSYEKSQRDILKADIIHFM